MRILFVADIYAKPGRRVASEVIPRLINERAVDFCIVNGENAAGGFGLTDNLAKKIFSYGADVITSGNHIWNRADFMPFLRSPAPVLRPFNYPSEAPGKGSIVLPSRSGTKVGVVNLQGRTFMSTTDCPFKAGRSEVQRLRQETPIVFVDFHAEATAEKVSMGWHLDGLASAVIGTHTHIQTADERILPGGTAYLTDAGMTGTPDSVIGTRADIAVQRFISQVPARFKPADGIGVLCGALVDVDEAGGRATAIERLQLAESAQSASAEDDDSE
jgi:hypothetical protein